MANQNNTPTVPARQFPTHIHPSLSTEDAVKQLLLSIREKHALFLYKASSVTEIMRADIRPDAFLDARDTRNLRFYERCFRAAQRLFTLEVTLCRFCREGGAA